MATNIGHPILDRKKRGDVFTADQHNAIVDIINGLSAVNIRPPRQVVPATGGIKVEREVEVLDASHSDWVMARDLDTNEELKVALPWYLRITSYQERAGITYQRLGVRLRKATKIITFQSQVDTYVWYETTVPSYEAGDHLTIGKAPRLIMLPTNEEDPEEGEKEAFEWYDKNETGRCWGRDNG